MERGKYLEITLFDADGSFVCEISQTEFFEIFARADIYHPLSEYIDEL